MKDGDDGDRTTIEASSGGATVGDLGRTIADSDGLGGIPLNPTLECTQGVATEAAFGEPAATEAGSGAAWPARRAIPVVAG